MSDRELLELAAKAAGLPAFWDELSNAMRVKSDAGNWYLWRPQHDDGDAFRLFLALPWMCLETSDVGVTVRERGEKCERVYLKCTEWLDKHNGDPYAATRRAIVRAAAEIGRDDD